MEEVVVAWDPIATVAAEAAMGASAAGAQRLRKKVVSNYSILYIYISLQCLYNYILCSISKDFKSDQRPRWGRNHLLNVLSKGHSTENVHL